MPSSIRRALFPDPPREFAGRRGVKIVLRAVHVLCVSLFTGAVAFQDAGAPARSFWLWAAVASGSLMLLLDLHETAAFLLQVRGLVVTAKILSLGLLHLLSDAQAVGLLGAVIVVSVLSSHAPGSIRHRVVVGTVRGAETSG